ncbi:NAD(P)-dependent oxidoreductase [Deferribacter thermophilus]|uniref:NAD(P)-dependent oxidoreductase n=1 Tax=Deferribacter thermophilus TaxID=53573 RepID=UPI003C1FA91D
MKLGFIGFGKLGSAMVENLLNHDIEIIGWNRTKSKMEQFDKVVKKDTPFQIWEDGVEVVILNLFDSKSVKEVLFGENGLINDQVKNKIIIDTTTNHYEEVLEISDRVIESGNEYIEAPVIGSVVPAKNGSLVVLAGCKKVLFDKYEHILSLFGNKIFHFEEYGIATKFKLINNMVLGSFMAVLKEAINMAEMIGLDRNTAINLLENGAGDSLVLRGKKSKVLSRDYTAHFDVKTLLKDLDYYYDMAKENNYPTIISSMIKEIYRALEKNNLGDKDFSSIVDELY